ncbi:MAG: hypothetical protein ACK42Y_01970 [Candidatus Thermochlorobacter sp.]
MTQKEKLLLELPDFIMGKTPEALTKEIQRLIDTDANFRAEYDALCETMEQVKRFSETAFERAPKVDVPPFYFETFADRVQQRLAAQPQSFWQKCLEFLQTLFAPEQRYQFAGALAGIVVVLLMMLAALRLDMHTNLQAEFAESQSKGSVQGFELVSTMHYAASLSPELLVSSLSEEEATLLLEAMMYELSDEEKFKTLSEEEVEVLMKML